MSDLIIEDNVLVQYSGNDQVVAVPEGVTKIGDFVFQDCIHLKEVKIPKTVTEIGHFAFMGCFELRKLIIPDSVVAVGNYAFKYCAELKKLVIPTSVKTIGYFAFNDTPWFDGLNDEFNIVGHGILIKYGGQNKDVKIPTTRIVGQKGFVISTLNQKIAAPAEPEPVVEEKPKPKEVAEKRAGRERRRPRGRMGADAEPVDVTPLEKKAEKEPEVNIDLANTILSINSDAFNSSQLVNIVIPTSVGKIGEGAFYKCTDLKAISIPNSINEIADRSFLACSGLTEVTIPDTITKIGESAFKDCVRLKSVIIPATVTEISKNAFKGCSSLASVVMENKSVKVGQDAFKSTLWVKMIGAARFRELYGA